MKNIFNMELFKFRWSKMTKDVHARFIASMVLFGLSIVFLGVSVFMSYDANLTGKYVWTLLSFSSFAWAILFVRKVIQANGRIDQKYLKEMNEIRAKLGRELLEDI